MSATMTPTAASRDFALIWNSLPSPALSVARNGAIAAVNGAAESFLGASERQLLGQSLPALAGAASRVAALVEQVAKNHVSMAEYDVEFTWPDAPPRLVDLHAAPLGEEAEAVLLIFHPRAIAESMDRSLTHRDAARSVAGMAAMLAHEVKNPLAGISGAAQLLAMSLGAEERELTDLIREETERVGKLLERVEQFGAMGPGRHEPVNIHDVLDRACRAAKAGFAAHARFIEEYDPSLPPTMGDADQLMQVMQNLLKNAAEATPKVGGLITVRTSYRAGMKVRGPTGGYESLPLQVVIADNGAGVPEEIRRHIFEPFVTSKSTGSGLGLALVSKIVADHGGVISCESEPGWTRMRLRLPVATARDLEAHSNSEESAA
ncbi:ATP-binding protein [Limibaculum sp. FT325]|uniref:two-component system sensor histidine kinase NtrB n=1 Tax=Thermohalobaculum sediminis TaxID=2939436 RepID=UPI0020BF0246|nr:ATP-binding protein [Limibaculum sediminis]MCL5778747.1 ATP-binding protein [Limibaculum sediminis]